MQFTTQRPLADQLAESVIENPEEWAKLNSSTIEHKSGIQLRIIWLSGGNSASIEHPDVKAIDFSSEEKTLLANCIEKHLKNLTAEKAAKETQQIVALFNRSQEPPRGWNVVGDNDTDNTDPINYFARIAKYCTFLLLGIPLIIGLAIALSS